jgi:hypothetical protein
MNGELVGGGGGGGGGELKALVLRGRQSFSLMKNVRTWTLNVVKVSPDS